MSTSSELIRELQELTSRLENGAKLSGLELADILRGITAREIEQGGPYSDHDSEPDIGLNLCIRRFLKALNVSLPNLDKFIQERESTEQSSVFLTTDEVLEELRIFHEGSPDTVPTVLEGVTTAEAEIMDAVRSALTKRTAGTTTEISEGAQYIIERTINANADKQMSLMSLYMRQALGPKGESFSNELLGELGFANACFWSSFIVYDDFWDEDEVAEPKQLPVANFLARNYIRFFCELCDKESGFSEFVHAIMDKVDAANSWETIHCRTKISNRKLLVPKDLPEYDDFGIKYYPAAGHILGPVAMLLQLGYKIDSPEVSSLIGYFRNYLIAMQLNDDLHDWKEDLERGHISTVVAVLLGVWKQRYSTAIEIHLVNDLPELEKIFWYEVLEPICKLIFYRCEESRKYLKQLKILENLAPLEMFISRNEIAAQKALDEYRLSRELLSAFVPNA